MIRVYLWYVFNIVFFCFLFVCLHFSVSICVWLYVFIVFKWYFEFKECRDVFLFCVWDAVLRIERCLDRVVIHAVMLYLFVWVLMILSYCFYSDVVFVCMSVDYIELLFYVCVTKICIVLVSCVSDSRVC